MNVYWVFTEKNSLNSTMLVSTTSLPFLCCQCESYTIRLSDNIHRLSHSRKHTCIPSFHEAAWVDTVSFTQQCESILLSLSMTKKKNKKREWSELNVSLSMIMRLNGLVHKYNWTAHSRSLSFSTSCPFASLCCS